MFSQIYNTLCKLVGIINRYRIIYNINILSEGGVAGCPQGSGIAPMVLEESQDFGVKYGYVSELLRKVIKKLYFKLEN